MHTPDTKQQGTLPFLILTLLVLPSSDQFQLLYILLERVKTHSSILVYILYVKIYF